MKKLFTIAALLYSTGAFADDFSLYFDSANSPQSTVIARVSDIKKLVFENGNVIAVMKDNTEKSTSITDIKRLFFSTEDAVSIDELAVKTTDAAKDGEVYDLAGRKLNVNPQTPKLQKGVYIINGKKVMVK